MKPSNEHPIIFNTPMVRAILSDRKNMTRRIIDPQPDDNGLWNDDQFSRSLQSDLKGWNGTVEETGESKEFKCPYGKIGDRLYVRETWAWTYNQKAERWDSIYKADGIWWDDEGPVKWKPSIHMPKKFARIWLEITDIRVERLHDISEEDAMREGVEWVWYDESLNIKMESAKVLFYDLWKTIYGKESFIKNPWVWVISFKRV